MHVLAWITYSDAVCSVLRSDPVCWSTGPFDTSLLAYCLQQHMMQLILMHMCVRILQALHGWGQGQGSGAQDLRAFLLAAARPAAAMALDILRVVQIMWALGDVLLTGGAFAVLGVYGGDADANCRYGGLFLWTLCGIAPAVLYISGV
jgi:hypothetical protein